MKKEMKKLGKRISTATLAIATSILLLPGGTNETKAETQVPLNVFLYNPNVGEWGEYEENTSLSGSFATANENVTHVKLTIDAYWPMQDGATPASGYDYVVEYGFNPLAADDNFTPASGTLIVPVPDGYVGTDASFNMQSDYFTIAATSTDSVTLSINDNYVLYCEEKIANQEYDYVSAGYIYLNLKEKSDSTTEATTTEATTEATTQATTTEATTAATTTEATTQATTTEAATSSATTAEAAAEATTATPVTITTPSTNAYSAVLDNNGSELTLLVLTEEEKKALESGATVNVWLEVADISSSVPAADKTTIETKAKEAAANYVVGTYLDIDLNKKVGETASAVTNTNGGLKVSVTLPENLQADNRTFKVVRLHDGVATILDATYDSATKKLSFETDQFSTYAIIYADTTAAPAATEAAKTSSPKTGDSTVPYVVFTLLGLAVFAGAFSLKKTIVK